MEILFIPAVVAGLLLIYVMVVYNRLVRRRAMMEEGWSGIDVQLKRRYDLVPNLVETVKAYARHEQETLDQVVRARNAAIGATAVADQGQAENALTSSLGGIFALAEAYPELKANSNYLHLQRELANIEGDIEKARRYYNATVRENNILVESLPSSLVAGLFKFSPGAFFEIAAREERAVPGIGR